MKQITKFYISSFLKNQTYFTPILIIFLQAQSLDFQQIFWVFTIGSIFSLLIEIPTGIFADLFGKRRSIIISKLGIFLSFVVFGFSSTFWMFVLAQILFELGNAFRSGTEAAFVYDYVRQNENTPIYTEVQGKQKFWARISESGATAIGGVIAAQFGFSWVFFIAAVPALVNFIIALSWEEIKERKGDKVVFRETIVHAKQSLRSIYDKRSLLIVTLNITLFSAVLAALQKFIQPYMVRAEIPVHWFGFIYAGSLALTAIAVRYAYLVENRIGTRRTINWLSFLAVIPALVIGFKHISLFGVALFFVVLIIENIRSPIANNEFHSNVDSVQRSTTGSVLALSKSLGKISILPIAGYFADTFSLFTAILILGGILLLNAAFFYIR
jgi:MFS family permease